MHTMTEQSAPRRRHLKTWLVAGGALLAVLSIAVVLMLVFVLPGGEAGARTACEQFVTNAIKTPSTAKFPDGARVEKNPVGAYVVTGEVDAQNGFGAMIRQTYTCTVTHDGRGQWELHKLDGLS